MTDPNTTSSTSDEQAVPDLLGGINPATLVDPSVKPALREQFSLARAKKAYGAGVGGALAGAATISLSGVFADGKVDGTEVVGAIGAVVGGFVLGFVGAWLPAQPGSVTQDNAQHLAD